MSPSARRRSRTLTSLTASAMLVLTQLTPVSATHAYDTEFHWEQNPGGGLIRWVSYRDRTNHDVLGTWFLHTMNHYYEADNRWRPYRVPNSDSSRMVGKSYYSEGTWWGVTFTTPPSPPSKHTVDAEFKFNEKTLGGAPASEIHTVMCHEIGHAGGLDHNPSTDSCVFKFHMQAEEDFLPHDSDEIKRLHGHSD